VSDAKVGPPPTTPLEKEHQPLSAAQRFLSWLIKEKPPKLPHERDGRLVWRVTVPLAGLGLVFLGFYVWQCVLCPSRAFGAGALLASAAFTSGSLLGLLFGVPQISASGARADVTNNNLVQVSDWLTKVLVGATLTQANTIPGGLGYFGKKYGAALGGSEGGGDAVAIFLLVHFLMTGFLFGFLLTRLVLQPALARAVGPDLEKAPPPPASLEGPPPSDIAKEPLPQAADEAPPSSKNLDPSDPVDDGPPPEDSNEPPAPGGSP